MNFDISYDHLENHFVKNNPAFLKKMFGHADLMPLWVADMDFKVAQPILDELQRLTDRGVFAYEEDTKTLFESIITWQSQRNHVQFDLQNLVLVPNVLSGIALLLRQLTDAGDGVVIQTPVYHQFANAIKINGRSVVNNPMKLLGGKYVMDFEDLEAKFKSDNTKAMILCNPHNPVGRVWTKSELQQLVGLANEYGVTIISDEIHADIVFANNRFTSLMCLDAENHAALLGSPAKTFGMQGIGTGVVYLPNTDMKEQYATEVEAMFLNHANAFTTFGTIAAYQKGGVWVDELLVYLQETIHWIGEFLEKELPQVRLIEPEGTYQVWLDFSQLGMSEDELKQLVFEKAKLGLAPGSWFGEGNEQFMRLNIASPLEKIQQAFHRLKAAL